jgi:hypothetical protein
MAWRRARQELRRRQQELDLAVETLTAHDPKLSKEKAHEVAQRKSPGFAAARKRYLELTDKLELVVFEFEKVFVKAKAAERKKSQVPWRAIAGAAAGFVGALGQEMERGAAPEGIRGKVIDTQGESV